MGVVVESVEELLDALVNKGVVRDVVVPILQLRGGGQLAVENQIGRLGVSALFGELFDGIAAISQNAFVAVDEGDFARTARGVRQSRIVAHHSEIRRVDLDLAQVHGADRVVIDRNFVLPASAIINDGESVAPRRGAISDSRSWS